MSGASGSGIDARICKRIVAVARRTDARTKSAAMRPASPIARTAQNGVAEVISSVTIYVAQCIDDVIYACRLHAGRSLRNGRCNKMNDSTNKLPIAE